MLLLILVFLFLIGCKGNATVLQGVSDDASKIKSSLIKEGALSALEKYQIKLGIGESKTNKIVIKNNYDVKTKFKIEYCNDCEGYTLIEIDSKQFKTVKFTVTGAKVSGEYEYNIKVRDELDNMYSLEKFNVTIE